MSLPALPCVSSFEATSKLIFFITIVLHLALAQTENFTCLLCENGEEAAILSNPSAPSAHVAACKGLQNLFEVDGRIYFNDEETCQTEAKRAGYLCGCSGAVEPSDTVNCTLCPGGTPPAYPERNVGMLYDTITCQGLEFYVTVSNKDLCDFYEQSHFPFLCGCSSAPPLPEGSCVTMCMDGTPIPNPNATFTLGELNFTCQEYEDILINTEPLPEGYDCDVIADVRTRVCGCSSSSALTSSDGHSNIVPNKVWKALVYTAAFTFIVVLL